MAVKILLTAVILSIALFSSFSQENQKISTIGTYNGYSTLKYDSFFRESRYVKMSDGTRLAVDIYRPIKNGITETAPLPVVWNHTRYTRALKGPQGNILTLATSPIGMALIRRGYVTVIADARGTGASFGTQNGLFTKREAQDAYEITEWLAKQEWCNGKIGMMGGSYEGVTQLMAAAKKPPHLKAIFPAMFLFDLYNFPYHNGVYYNDCIISDKNKMSKGAASKIDFIAPVDNDLMKTDLKTAYSSRSENRFLDDIFSISKYRNSFDSLTQSYLYKDWSPSNYVEEINHSGIAVYIYGGWFDLFSKDAFLLYANLTGPKKLLMVDSPHSSSKNPKLIQLFITEQIRWFDYWLKDIPNGIMDEPQIALQKNGETATENLTLSDTWPLNNTQNLNVYFQEGKSGSVNSLNDGILDMKKPVDNAGFEKYMADFSATSGTQTRWDDAAIKKFSYPDMTANDEKGITFTLLNPLQNKLTICGHPIITCYANSSCGDFDLYVYLEDVAPNGVSSYLSEGCIRASFYKQTEAPYNNLGLPYHRCYQEDTANINPGEIYKLSFDMLPLYHQFEKGHKIRVTLTCADKDNTNSHIIFKESEITVFRDALHSSFIRLPLLVNN
ncbi:CocE/NonD family hydrolase [Maribellus comscasis]|uniref:CocE/NonD family hydrolase n=1 Tax=Maribellus comscasis TaxID=2681766 RepID=A0A6I6JQ70_9BACT|nr:CocE/NonD family hydrolase [Maribellus comscasis]QGY43160.1 CocE/NonD family hydrolase [Maribellus comscasis]